MDVHADGFSDVMRQPGIEIFLEPCQLVASRTDAMPVFGFLAVKQGHQI